MSLFTTNQSKIFKNFRKFSIFFFNFCVDFDFFPKFSENPAFSLGGRVRHRPGWVSRVHTTSYTNSRLAKWTFRKANLLFLKGVVLRSAGSSYECEKNIIKRQVEHKRMLQREKIANFHRGVYHAKLEALNRTVYLRKYRACAILRDLNVQILNYTFNLEMEGLFFSWKGLIGPRPSVNRRGSRAA